VIGLDLASEPARREALERARDGARMATTPDVRLRGVSGNPRGFFVALPVYRRGMSHRTPEERRRNTSGILGGSFQTAAVVDEILREAKLPGGVDLYLFAADAKGDANSKMLALAETDLLTNLANRRAFLKHLTQALAADSEGAPRFGVLYIDIDDFKDVNDTPRPPDGRRG